jgi:hypothetical protein
VHQIGEQPAFASLGQGGHAHPRRDCFVTSFLATTTFFRVIASAAKQSRENASAIASGFLCRGSLRLDLI